MSDNQQKPADNEVTNHDQDDHQHSENQNVADRGIPSVAKKSGKGGIGQKLGIIAFAAIVILALVAVNGGFSGDGKPKPKKDDGKSLISNRLGATPAPPPLPVRKTEQDPGETGDSHLITTSNPPPPPRTPAAGGNNRQQPMTPAQRKRAGFASSGSGSTSAAGGANQPTVSTGASFDGSGEVEEADGLAARLKVTKLGGNRASVMRDRSFFITKGTAIDCSLDTAISSDQPGGLACTLSRDVYSTDLKVKLLDAGSIVTGQYKGGLMRGQARIFAIWERVETPSGVIIDIDSPATDALGRGGIGGYVDTHFADRFGGAIMLSIIGDIGRYASNTARSGDNNQIQFSGTTDSMKDAASIALENSINIPNTLHANQGDHVAIYVARDLDFRGVYALKAVD